MTEPQKTIIDQEIKELLGSDNILQSEDTEFTKEQSAQLSPLLLEFAGRHSDSDDPQVLSAIRLGASMLRPTQAMRLLPLFEGSGTSLVALKMLGRIFEAQPPDDIDQYELLSIKVQDIAWFLTNKDAINIPSNAAKVNVAVYALAAMGSSRLIPTVQKIRQMDVEWFTKLTIHTLQELESYQGRNVASSHRDLVTAALIAI